MFIGYSSRAAGLGTIALCVAAVVVGCGGDDSTPSTADHETGGTEDAGTGGSTDGTGGSTGGATSGTSGAAGAGDVLVPIACGKEPAPDSGLVTEFSDIDVGTTWNSGQKKFGDTTFGGGTFHYPGGGDNLTATITGGGALALQGTVVAGDYAGFGLWLTNCTDASAFEGITFTLGGDLGGSTILFQMQMSRDYPIDPSASKGECEFQDADDKWSECVNNEVSLGSPDAGVLEFEWGQFKGGQPITPLDPTELLGIQWQFQCETEGDCVVDVTLDNIKFLDPVTNPFDKQTSTATGGAGGAGGSDATGGAGDVTAAGAGGAAG